MPAVLTDRVSYVQRVLFVAFAIATAVHIGFVMAHEPFSFDAWNLAQDTGARPFSLGNFLEYGVGQYTHSNPRIGQWLTYLAYKLEYFAVIATPLAYLALSLAVTVLGLGRWPRWRRGRDLALVAIALGCLWFALPRLGMIMFCRAYGANYVYGAVIQLWFLVVLRLRPTGEGSVGEAVAFALLGIAAGMSNEHTGPTLVLFALGFAAWRHRGGARPRLAWAGAFGVTAGFAAIFFAPGQGERYDGLATKVGLFGRLLKRGVDGNLDILVDFLIGAMPILAFVVVLVVIGARDGDRSAQRTPLVLFGWAFAAATLIAVTVFVSPKLGPRFYLHGCALMFAGLIGVADAVLTTRRRLAPFLVLAVATSVYAGVKTVPLFARLDQASDARLAALAASKPGSVFTAVAFSQVEESWWFLGDDFRDIKKRELVTKYFALRDVVVRAIDLDAPLIVSDVRIVPRYATTPAGCVDVGGFDLGQFRGWDVASMQRAGVSAIERVRSRLGDKGQIDRADLVVDFLGDPPPLPRPTLLLGRWTPAGFEGWAGAIEKRGVSTTRSIVIPPTLKQLDLEILIYVVGGEARSLGTSRAGELSYKPWEHGTYWALACRPTECFVIAAARLQ